MTYPIERNAPRVDHTMIAAYLEMLFDYVDWEFGQCINLRGIGEKGTPQEGVFRERKPLASNAGAAQVVR